MHRVLVHEPTMRPGIHKLVGESALVPVLSQVRLGSLDLDTGGFFMNNVASFQVRMM